MMVMKMADGKIATNGKENMAVFGPHFDRVFNNHRPVDLTILDDVPQRPPFMTLTCTSHLQKLMLPLTNSKVARVLD